MLSTQCTVGPWFQAGIGQHVPAWFVGGTPAPLMAQQYWYCHGRLKGREDGCVKQWRGDGVGASVCKGAKVQCNGALLIQLELCASQIHCKPELGHARDSVYEWSTKKAHACAWHERSHQQAHRHTSAPTQTYLLFKIFTLASCGNDLVGVTRCQVPAESRAREAP